MLRCGSEHTEVLMPEGAPVHFIAHFTVDDPAAYRVYEQGFFPILKAHGGRFITYDDAAPWPVSADGGGSTLQRVDAALPAGLASSWKASTTKGGSPGGP